MNYEKFYKELISVLKKTKTIKTCSKGKINRIKIIDSKIYVATLHSHWQYKEIPEEFIKKAFNAVVKQKEVTQYRLSKELNIKRSAFIMAAFNLLTSIKYDCQNNSIKII